MSVELFNKITEFDFFAQVAFVQSVKKQNNLNEQTGKLHGSCCEDICKVR